MSFGFSAGDFVTAATLTYKLVLALSESSAEYQQLIQDLACVHRTLLQVEQMKDANQLNQSTINALRQQVDSAKQPMQAFLERTEKYRKPLGGGGSSNVLRDSWRRVGWSMHQKSEVKALRELLQLRLLSINVLLSTACYLVVKSSPITLGESCELESAQDVPVPDWNSDLVIFEHIGLTNGAQGRRDPTFASQGTEAQKYFRAGQVFMMLWDTSNVADIVNVDVDDEPGLREERDRRSMMSNNWMSPYIGPTTVRRFLVVREGIRSSYCFTFQLRGCSKQPDQEHYGIIFTGNYPPNPLPEEIRMIKPPIRVNVNHPSAVLRPESRIDYRRLCEIEHNVHCQDVGLVDVDSMNNLLQQLEPCRANPKAEFHLEESSDGDDMDPGIE